jgi:hypothetical protein
VEVSANRVVRQTGLDEKRAIKTRGWRGGFHGRGTEPLLEVKPGAVRLVR